MQKRLQDAVGEDKIAKHVNADEAAVFGAAFKAASLSPQFKTKEIRTLDINPYSIYVTYASEKGETAGRNVTQKLYETMSRTGTRKKMSFKRAAISASSSPPTTAIPSLKFSVHYDASEKERDPYVE